MEFKIVLSESSVLLKSNHKNFSRNLNLSEYSNLNIKIPETLT